MDHGKVVEFGTPWELIQANGAFRELVKQSGEENSLIEVCLSHNQETKSDADQCSLLEVSMRKRNEYRHYR